MLRKFFAITAGGLWSAHVAPKADGPISFTRFIARAGMALEPNRQCAAVWIDWRHDQLVLHNRLCVGPTARLFPYIMLLVREDEAREMFKWEIEKVRLHTYPRGEFLRALDGVEDKRFLIIDSRMIPPPKTKVT